MCCAVLFHLYNLKNVKNNHGGVLLLVKLQAKSVGPKLSRGKEGGNETQKTKIPILSSIEKLGWRNIWQSSNIVVNIVVNPSYRSFHYYYFYQYHLYFKLVYTIV